MVCVLQSSDDSAPLVVIRDKLSPRRHFLFVQLKDPPPFYCLQYGSFFFFFFVVKVYQPLTVGVNGTKAVPMEETLICGQCRRQGYGLGKNSPAGRSGNQSQASDLHTGAPHAEI